MDFSQVKAITIPEGSVNRILSGATVLWKKSSGGLPSEYQEVEYLESSGTQWINTQYSLWATSNWKLECKFSITATPQQDSALFGLSRSGATYKMLVTPDLNLNMVMPTFGGRTISAVQTNTEYVLECDNTGTYFMSYLNGSLRNRLTRSATAVSSPVLIFHDMNAAYASLSGRIYYAKFWAGEDGTLVRDFVPCYRKSDGVAGLYDLVNGVFYTNSGTGTFSVGEDVFTLPPEYQLVSYIESTGTQYIDTGYRPNQDTVLTGKYYVQNITGVVAFVRWSGAPEYDTFGLYNGGTGLTTVYYGRYSDNKYTGNIGGMVNTIVNVDIGLTSVTLNNNQYNITRDQFQSPYSLYLFAGNNMGTLANQSHCKIYRMTIRENSTVMLDFVPCYRKSDEKPGLYDMMSNTFYTNGGTGEFIIGPEPYPLPSGYQQVDYLESSGTQAINTEIPINTIGNNSTTFKLRFAVPASNNGGTLMGANDSRKQMVLTGQRIRTDWANGSSSGYLVTGLSVLPPYIIEQKDGYLSCNGQSAEITTTATGTLPCGLFARIDNAAGTTLNNLATTRIYGFAAEGSDGAICNMVPCYRKSDNEPGMYDLVRGAFYANVGTGVFTLGPDV